MTFNQKIKNSLFPILGIYGFDILHEYNNIIHFNNDIFSIEISHYELHKTNSISIGRKNHQAYPINNEVLRSIFGSDLKIEELPIDKFVENLEIFFKTYSTILFDKNEHIVKKIEIEIESQSLRYAKERDIRYYLNIADKAWLEKDFNQFIIALDKLDFSSIPKSYSLKYQFAKKNK
jgi:hypothetical protein